MFSRRYFLEIKYRLFLLLGSWSMIIFMSYFFKDILLSILINNLFTKNTSFIFTDVTEVFSTHIHLCLFFSNQILAVFFVYHVFLFVLPSLTLYELNFLTFVFLVFIFLMLISVVIFNVFLFPLSWDFFLSFQSFGGLESFSLGFEAKLSDFCRFYTEFYFICVTYFQAFVIPILLLKFVNINFEFYSSFRKLLVYSCVIFSTIVTPPDVFSQIIISFCSIFCCEILVFVTILKKHFLLIRQPIKTYQNTRS